MAHLTARGRRALATREPSTGPIGRLLREILLGGHRLPDGTPADGRAMALLFAADRRDHLRREIEPALAAGADVVCDRYLLSSLAYQGEEAERDWVAELAREVRPADLTLLLDLPVAVAAARRRAAGRVEERYDADAVQERVAAAYRHARGRRREGPHDRRQRQHRRRSRARSPRRWTACSSDAPLTRGVRYLWAFLPFAFFALTCFFGLAVACAAFGAAGVVGFLRGGGGLLSAGLLGGLLLRRRAPASAEPAASLPEAAWASSVSSSASWPRRSSRRPSTSCS